MTPSADPKSGAPIVVLKEIERRITPCSCGGEAVCKAFQTILARVLGASQGLTRNAARQ